MDGVRALSDLPAFGEQLTLVFVYFPFFLFDQKESKTN